MHCLHELTLKRRIYGLSEQSGIVRSFHFLSRCGRRLLANNSQVYGTSATVFSQHLQLLQEMRICRPR